MNKLDLWGNCPYSPTHRFKNNVCVGCGLKKPKLPNLIDITRKERETLEDRINKILEIKRKRATIEYAWGDWFTPTGVCSVYGHSNHLDEAPWKAPSSAPLNGERKKNQRRLRKVAKLYSFYETNWPIAKTYLHDVFSVLTVEPDVQYSVEAFVHTLVCYGSIITKNQIEELTAAITYCLSGLPERKVAEEPNSLFPQVTRKTLRKWVKTVEDFQKADLG